MCPLPVATDQYPLRKKERKKDKREVQKKIREGEKQKGVGYGESLEREEKIKPLSTFQQPVLKQERKKATLMMMMMMPLLNEKLMFVLSCVGLQHGRKGEKGRVVD